MTSYMKRVWEIDLYHPLRVLLEHNNRHLWVYMTFIILCLLDLPKANS